MCGSTIRQLVTCTLSVCKMGDTVLYTKILFGRAATLHKQKQTMFIAMLQVVMHGIGWMVRYRMFQQIFLNGNL